MADADDIRALEVRRCTPLGEGDVIALADLMDEDYIHVHGNGRVTDKAATLARIGAHARATERGDLVIRIWGDVALIVGEQINRGTDGLTCGMVTQTLRRRHGIWRFQSLHFTAIRD